MQSSFFPASQLGNRLTELILLTRLSLHIEFAKLRCGEKTCIDVNSTILLIFKNFQTTFHIFIVTVLKNMMQNVENYKQNTCLVSFMHGNIIVNTNFETSQNDGSW